MSDRRPENRAEAAADRAASRRAGYEADEAGVLPPETFAAGRGDEPAGVAWAGPAPGEAAGGRAFTRAEARGDGESFEPPQRPIARPRPRVPPQRRPPVRPSRAPAGRVPKPPRQPRAGRSWGGRLGALVALLVIAVTLFFINRTFQPFHGSGEGSVRVSIPEGADAGRIGDVLAGRGVVDSGTFFSMNATLTGRRGRLRAGDYTLARDMSYGDAIEQLTQGPRVRRRVVPTFRVTLPEGPSRRELAPIVRRAGVRGSYVSATARPTFLRRARRLGLRASAPSLEGFLFPATYQLRRGSNAVDLVRRQLDAFEENFRRVDLAAARRRNLTRYDVVTIAAMVERETTLARERPLVAAVIHNRLRQGIPLGIDATIRYAENNWTRPLLESQLQRPGPYNTRLNQGLPAGPIGNPGLASLRAAARPASVDHLYYVVRPCGEGAHNFSSSFEEFQRDTQRYNAERERRGGRSPTEC